MPENGFPRRGREENKVSQSSPTEDISDEDEFYDAYENIVHDVFYNEDENEQASEVAEIPSDDSESAKLEASDEEIHKQILEKVELLLSDEYLRKNVYLRKRCEKSENGFIPIKVLCSLRKIKGITKNWKIVKLCLQKETPEHLELDDDRNAIRRKVAFDFASVPEKEEKINITSKVLVTNLPSDRRTEESLTKLFSEFGEVKSVRVLEPGNPLPDDLKDFAKKYSALQAMRICAVVELPRASAKKAVKKLDGKKDDWRAMHMAILEKTRMKVSSSSDDLRKHCNLKQPIKNPLARELRLSECETDSDSPTCLDRRASLPIPEHYYRAHRLSCTSLSEDSEYGSTPQDSPKSSRRRLNSVNSVSYSPLNNSVCSSRHNSISSSRQNSNSTSRNNSISSLGSEPWSPRRLQSFNLPGSVLRQPRGPDGTKGFDQSLFRSIEVAVT